MRLSTRHQINALIQDLNDEKRADFAARGSGKRNNRYTGNQKGWAIIQAQEIGVRATARLLGLHRKTIQRWLRAEGIWVKPCPDWVYDWAYWRRKKREKWERIKAYRGY